MRSGFGNWFSPGSARPALRSITTYPLALLTIALCGGVMAAAPLAAHVGTQTTLNAKVEQAAAGARAIFTVHVAPEQGSTTASGVVTIVDGVREIGSAVLDTGGDATVESTGLLAGAHTLHALYSGDDRFAASLSAQSQVSTEAAGPITFTAAASPTALNVKQGNSISTTISLTPLNGFSNYVSLSCTGLPADSTCVFLPATVFVTGTKATTSVLSIETYGVTGPDALLQRHSSLVLAMVFPGLLALAGLGMRRRGAGWQRLGAGMLIIAGLGSLGGCAQRYHYLNRPPAASPGTPLGSTTITIEAQAVSGVNVTTQLIQNVVLTVQAPAS